MLVQKFDYDLHKITRIDGDGPRTYQTISGRVPSVTTVLEACKDIADKEGLAAWRDFVGEQQAATILKNSSDIGTLLHTHMECYVKGEPRPGGSNVIRKIATALADSMIANGFDNHVGEVWGTEVQLYYPGLYAGTTDCVAVHDGTPAILDYKNARRIRTNDQVKYYKLQTVAYSEAHNALYGTNIHKTVIMLVVRDDRNNNENFGKYQEWVIEGNEYDKVAYDWCKMVEKYHNIIN